MNQYKYKCHKGTFLIGNMLKVFLIVILLGSFTPVIADQLDHQTKTEIAKLLQQNIQASNDEDIEEYMKTLHSQSPVYSTTKEAGKEIISIYDLKYEIVETIYIRKEHGRFTARIKLKTTKISGPEFKDNVIDQIYIFHKENDKWKIWNTETIDIKYL